MLVFSVMIQYCVSDLIYVIFVYCELSVCDYVYRRGSDLADARVFCDVSDLVDKPERVAEVLPAGLEHRTLRRSHELTELRHHLIHTHTHTHTPIATLHASSDRVYIDEAIFMRWSPSAPHLWRLSPRSCGNTRTRARGHVSSMLELKSVLSSGRTKASVASGSLHRVSARIPARFTPVPLQPSAILPVSPARDRSGLLQQ